MPIQNLRPGAFYTIAPNQQNIVNFTITVHQNLAPAQATITILNGQALVAEQTTNLNPMQVRNIPYNAQYQYVIMNTSANVPSNAGLDINP